MRCILILLISLFLLFGINLSAKNSVSQSLEIRSKYLDKEIPATKQIETIVLGSGCFWGAEKRYESIPGVIDAMSGYADGNGIEPIYQAITKEQHRFNPNNFAEVVKVTFNPTVVSLEDILKNFFEGHDPTQQNRQGNDLGTQYRSTILIQSPKQQKIAEEIKSLYQPLLSSAGYGGIKTVIKTLTAFYPAENYHQDYLAKNPNG